MPEMPQISRWLMIGGLSLFGLGALIWLFGRVGLPLGRLPGDLRLQVGGTSIFIPLASGILLSILLTLALNVILRILNR